MAQSKRTHSSARQRLLETAEQLFYAEGVRAVGIDRIIAESGVAKMTLYNHFKSKDDLILAVLKYREEKFDALFRERLSRHERKGLDRLNAFFAALKDWFRSPDFRGCAFINACVELADPQHAAVQFAAAHKVRFHDMLYEVVRQVGGEKALRQAPAIALIVEGAIISAVMEQSPASADVAREAANALILKKSRAAR